MYKAAYGTLSASRPANIISRLGTLYYGATPPLTVPSMTNPNIRLTQSGRVLVNFQLADGDEDGDLFDALLAIRTEIFTVLVGMIDLVKQELPEDADELGDWESYVRLCQPIWEAMRVQILRFPNRRIDDIIANGIKCGEPETETVVVKLPAIGEARKRRVWLEQLQAEEDADV